MRFHVSKQAGEERAFEDQKISIRTEVEMEIEVKGKV